MKEADLPRKLAATKRQLDAVSPSFCLAKWLQVTLHLQNGHNHSCHHPDLHRASVEEITKRPNALHNTQFKKELRKQMLAGERPSECAYCWKVEDSGAPFSDRIIKSNDEWAHPQLKDIAALDWKKNINPSYLEVSFGNQCNFQCIYCAPQYSSSIWKDYEQNGPYIGRVPLESTIAAGQRPIPADQKNPYLDAFWKWFPRLVKDLKVFRITGGEPLLNANTFRVLDYIAENPQPHLELCVNTNLGIPDRQYVQFLEKINALTGDKKIKKFMLFTSIDSHGEQAEYIRVGLRYEKWLANVRRYLKETNSPLVSMCAFSLMSPPSFPLLLRELSGLNAEFPPLSKERKRRVILDISHITYPPYFSVRLLNSAWQKKIGAILGEMDALDFSEAEMNKLARVLILLESSPLPPGELAQQRKMFFTFTKEQEARKGLSFEKIFPEMEDFYAACKARK